MSEPDVAEVWTEPKQSKLAITLSDGTRATTEWLFANGCRLPGPDVTRILAFPEQNTLRKSMIIAFGRTLRKVWIRRWCAAHGRKSNAWKDTPRSTRALEAAAAAWASEHATRGMTADMYIDAANELRPKSLKFVTVDMLGGMLAERIKSWVPHDQREQAKPWEAHEDRDGHAWVNLPGEATPVLVVRSPEDRALLKRMAGVK